MWWRQTETEHFAGVHGDNRRRLRELARRKLAPGLLAYLDGEVVGWCSVGPRADFGRLRRSTTLKPVDDEEVWSIVCFYIARHSRRAGIASALLEGAIEYARTHGARMIEGYPIDGGKRTIAGHTGPLPMFERAGFREVGRRAKQRPILRRTIEPSSTA